jgi:hypothetical protein
MGIRDRFRRRPRVVVENTGDEVSTDGGTAVSGFEGDASGASSVRVRNTGKATANGNGAKAVSGFSGRAPRGGKIVVKNTGPAIADGDGNAVSGIDYS